MRHHTAQKWLTESSRQADRLTLIVLEGKVKVDIANFDIKFLTKFLCTIF
jgi:hypothetical protein